MDTKSGHHLREKGKIRFMMNLNLSRTCQMHPRERERGGGGECISGCGHVDAIIGLSCWALPSSCSCFCSCWMQTVGCRREIAAQWQEKELAWVNSGERCLSSHTFGSNRTGPTNIITIFLKLLLFACCLCLFVVWVACFASVLPTCIVDEEAI